MDGRDLTGQRFGRLTGIEPGPRKVFGTSSASQWLCRCECGNEVTVLTGNLYSGNSKSCGCLQAEMRSKNGKAKFRHGLAHTPEWNSWRGARNRCFNKADEHYPAYGGRGIMFDPRWDTFEVFLADMGTRPDGMTLDRIDVDGPYGPENCRWLPYRDQSNNRRNNVRLTYNGETLSMADWSRRVGISRSALHRRLAAGWSLERALTTPTGS